ncbi:MAG: hypothetical protein WDW38_006093 [Sanguina aurantia]
MLKASTSLRISTRAVYLPVVSRVVARQASSTPPSANSQPRKRDFLRGLLGTYIVGAGIFGSQRSVATAATMSSEIEQILEDPKWPAKFPFNASDFARSDEQADTVFYSRERLVYHIDDPAVGAITGYYDQNLPASGSKDVALLDLCSSWVSHLPEGWTAGRVVGLGMNEDELKRNKQLTEYTVKDLNADPKLPYADNSFDVITNVVSVDYLNRPIEVFQEMHRVLKPGGTAIMSFSNRCFPTKAISLWTGTGDPDHVWIVGSYFHYSVPGGYTAPKSKDISPKPGRSDPMYVVYATKTA